MTAVEMLPVRRPRRTLYRYVARECVRPFLIALIGLTLVILTRDLMGYSELVINRGLTVGTVVGLALYEAVGVASSMFPFAVLIAALVALGRLGADREILVLQACGVSAHRLGGPIGLFAGGMALGSLGLAVWGAPSANRALDAELGAISREQPWASFRAGVVSRFGGWQVEAREVSAKGDELRGVLLWHPDLGETVFARRGRIAPAGGSGALEIELEEGSLVLSPEDGAQQFRFDALVTELPESDEPITRTADRQLAGLSLAELGEVDAAFVPSEGAGRVSRAAFEIQRRFTIPVATLLFGFLATPLFLTRRSYSRSGGSVIGVLATIAYFALVQLGEGLAQAGTLPILGGAWLPNGVLALLAGTLFLRARLIGVHGLASDRPHRRAPVLPDFSGHRAGRPRRHALPRYIGRRYLELFAAAFAVLLTAYLLIDVLDRLEWFARYRASGGEVLRFYAARAPLLASRVVPMALLVATALIVSLLAVEGELIGMRACGIPAPRALLPVLLLTVAVAPLYFALRDVVVPRTNALADELKQTEIKADYYRALAETRKSAVWQRTGSRVLEAERFDAERGDARALTIYEIGDDGLPSSRADARSARHIGRGIWRLVEPRRIEVDAEHVREIVAANYADLGLEIDAQVDTMHLSVGELSREIAAVEADGYDATTLRVDYHVKLADALICVVLPVSVLFFAVGGPPFPGPAQTLLVSGLLGVGYMLLAGVAASLGYGGRVPPIVGGWAPAVIFAAVATFFAGRLYRRL